MDRLLAGQLRGQDTYSQDSSLDNILAGQLRAALWSRSNLDQLRGKTVIHKFTYKIQFCKISKGR